MKGQLNYQFPIFIDQMEENGGYLNKDSACHACWWYLVLAERCRLTVGESKDDQIILEGEQWMDQRFEGIARGVATQYGLESPAEFLKYFPLIEKEAARLGVNVDGRVRNVFPGMDRLRST